MYVSGEGKTKAPGGGISRGNRGCLRGDPGPKTLRHPGVKPPYQGQGYCVWSRMRPKPPGFPSWSSACASLFPAGSPQHPQCCPLAGGCGSLAQLVAKLAPSSLTNDIPKSGLGTGTAHGHEHGWPMAGGDASLWNRDSGEMEEEREGRGSWCCAVPRVAVTGLMPSTPAPLPGLLSGQGEASPGPGLGTEAPRQPSGLGFRPVSPGQGLQAPANADRAVPRTRQ